MRLQFDNFVLDTLKRELLLDGSPVEIPPKAFDLLVYLVENRDRLVSKAELIDRFWSVEVSEAALLKAVSQARRTLAATEAGTRAIRTSYALGYRFTLPVITPADSAPPRERFWSTVLAVAGPVEAAEALVSAHGGEVLPGDAEPSFVFGSGATTGAAMDDAARRAVHCADALRKPAGCGVASARLAPGEAVGRTVANAQALARRAGPGGVLLDDQTCALLADEIETEPGPYGHLMSALSRPRAGVPLRSSGRQARLVGRDSELAFLAARLAMLEQGGGGQAILLSGGPGLGKTRLLTEFLNRNGGDRLRIAVLHCLPALANSAFGTVRNLCLALYPDPPASFFRDAADAALWSDMTGGAGDAAALASLSDRQRDLRQRALFVRIVAAAAESTVLIVAIEDVHWLDASSRACLDALVARIGEARLFLVMTARPVEGPSLTDVVLPLAPLSKVESLNMLQDPALSPDMDDRAAEVLVRRAAGNPFFIEELARVVETGGDPGVELPPNVQAVIGLRISVLDSAARRLLYAAAVIGPPASSGMIASLVGAEPDAVRQGLEDLIARDFLRDEGYGVRFRHMLIQDCAYDMLAEAERQEMHATVADLLEEAGDAAPEQLAHHHQEAGRPARAARYWRDASRAALHRSARHEAIAFARNGLALLRTDLDGAAKLELDLQLCFAPALTALKGFPDEEVGAAYARAETLLAGKSVSRTHIRVLVGLWIHTWVRGRLTASLGYADRIRQIAEQAGDPSLTLQAFAGLGQVQFHLGRMAEARDNLAAGLAAIEAAPPPTVPAQNAATSCAAYLGWTEALLGREEAACAALARSRALAELRENPYAEAIHYALSTETFFFFGDVAGCLDYANRAETLSRTHGFAFWLGTGLVMKGWCLGRMNRFDAAFAALDEGIAVFEATGAGVQVSNWHGLRAEVFLAAGRLGAGRAAAEHALELSRPEDLWFTPRIHATAARLAEAMGRQDEASRHWSEAQRLCNQFGLSPATVTLTG